MRITMTSVLVDDQTKARAFYTEVLGFELKHDVPLGEHRWITVVSPESPDGPELVLEPDEHPAARPFKDALVADGIPYTSFAVEDVHAEHERLTAAGVRFTQPPAEMGPGITTAVLDDTCGNLIQIASIATPDGT
jgi:catechol 2,3-dioxygenase-like lactoylglutathione lyase family enzyme